MDFGKLEATAYAALAQAHSGKTVMVSKAMATSLQNIPKGMSNHQLDAWLQCSGLGAGGYVISDDLFTQSESYATSKINKIIDNFWANPGSGEYQMYITIMQRKPKTKDVFKGKSTTHHYPWYKRGSKY